MISGNGRSPPPAPIVGESPLIRRAVELMDRYARTNLSVLLVGATGTGKELFAQHLHYRSGRRGRLAAVNCAALPRDTAESLLFGHRKGAFTGAVESRPGYFRQAHEGTLFLDELLGLPLECQAKLLRASETGEVWSLGDDAPIQVDVRIVAAVQEDVVARIETGVLRRDLYRRLAGVVLELPALRQRPEDIVPLARHFAVLSGRTLEAEVESVLVGHDWPDNVRELRQAIARAGHLVANGSIGAAALEQAIRLGGPCAAAAHVVDVGRERLLQACLANRWHAGRTAAALGVSRNTLRLRLKELGISLRTAKKHAFTSHE